MTLTQAALTTVVSHHKVFSLPFTVLSFHLFLFALSLPFLPFHSPISKSSAFPVLTIVKRCLKPVISER